MTQNTDTLQCEHRGDVNVIAQAGRILEGLATGDCIVEVQVACADCGETFTTLDDNGRFVRTGLKMVFRPREVSVAVNERDPFLG